MIFTNEDEQKLKHGINLILKQWPLYVGVITEKWGEYLKKSLKLLPKLMDCKKYKFDQMPYEEIDAVFVEELTEYILGMAVFNRRNRRVCRRHN